MMNNINNNNNSITSRNNVYLCKMMCLDRQINFKVNVNNHQMMNKSGNE